MCCPTRSRKLQSRPRNSGPRPERRKLPRGTATSSSRSGGDTDPRLRDVLGAGERLPALPLRAGALESVNGKPPLTTPVVSGGDVGPAGFDPRPLAPQPPGTATTRLQNKAIPRPRSRLHECLYRPVRSLTRASLFGFRLRATRLPTGRVRYLARRESRASFSPLQFSSPEFFSVWWDVPVLRCC
jgi:hypothetical protein